MELIDTPPPQALEMETHVLGAILLDRDAAEAVFSILRPADFYKGAHQKIYAVAAELGERGEIDQGILREELRSRGLLEEVGGVSYLADLVGNVPTTAHVEQYAAIVRERAELREIINTATELVRGGYEPGAEPYKLLAEAQERLIAIARNDSGPQPIRHAAGALWKRLEAGTEEPGLLTGLEPFDHQLGGMRAGEYYILAGRPSHGKSNIALRISLNLAMRGVPVFYASLEMTQRALVERAVWQTAGVDCRRQMPEGAERTRAMEAALKTADMPITIDDMTESLARLCATIRHAVHRDGCRLAIIDYIQLIESPDKENRQVQVSAISCALKHLARHARVPVLALAQLNRDSEKEKRPPQVVDLRESGSLEQDADAVFLTWRKNKNRPIGAGGDDGETQIILGKNRNGPTGAHTYMIGNRGQFDEVGGPF